VVPQVVVPQRADLILNARQLAATGAADFVFPGAGFTDLLTEKVAAVLAGSLDEGARKLSAELNELPTPNTIAAGLPLREAASTAA
jgi:UDP:flavonoid glycosyltransferase YjiC (YdhE family)